MYVHSPGSGPYSLRSLTAPRPPAKKKPAPHATPHAGPPTDAQLAQTQVSAAFDPVLKQITEAFNQRATAQQGAITGYSKTLADLMGSYAPESRAAYTGAAAGQSAVDASIAATREGQGASAQADLARRLADLHASPEAASRIAGGFSGDLAGEANATAARGGANLAMLLGEGAHAQDYGAKLPGIAAGMGLGATERAQGQITNEMRTALSELAAKRPDAYQSALSNISSTRQKQEQLNLENRLAIKKYGLDVSKANTAAAQGDTRLTIAQQNADTAAARAAQASANAERTFGLNLQKLKDAETKAAAARKAGGLTASGLAQLRKQAATDLETYYHGVAAKYQIGPNGQRVLVDGTGPGSELHYQDAIKSLTLKYPALGPKQIIAMANKLYAKGEGGRPSGVNQKQILSFLPSTPLG